MAIAIPAAIAIFPTLELLRKGITADQYTAIFAGGHDQGLGRDVHLDISAPLDVRIHRDKGQGPEA